MELLLSIIVNETPPIERCSMEAVKQFGREASQGSTGSTTSVSMSMSGSRVIIPEQASAKSVNGYKKE